MPFTLLRSIFKYWLFALWPFFLSAYTAIDHLPVLQDGRIAPLKAVASKQSLSSQELFDQNLKSEQLLLIPLKGATAEFAPLSILDQGPYNPTAYTENDFLELKQLYNKSKKEDVSSIFAQKLWEAYLPLAGTAYLKAKDKSLYYPSKLKLTLEIFYFDSYLTLVALCAYILAAFFFIFLPNSSKTPLAFAFFAFFIHSVILALRTYLLSRPPVSNMFETVIYVPWIAVFAGIAALKWTRAILIAASFCAAFLLLIQQVTGLNEQFQNVQAVLDSQYWLIVHVLMVVGSYGFFLLSAALAHIDLVKKHSGLTPYILKTLYIGTFLLISGTILGGIWAAESWGRFWDWDPKESWAFITSAVYVLFVHAYRFGKIGPFGLSVGSIIGFLSMSFTWYGVNYILGTGLHSYGFGNGGEIYYALFVLAEIIFLTAVFFRKRAFSPGE